jgi:Cu2+-exporting ATPase
VATVEGWDEGRALALATAVEGDSEHLIARGIRRRAEQLGVTPPPVRDFEAIKGRGIRARHDGRMVYVGGPRLLEMLEIDLADNLARFTAAVSKKGQSVVYLVDVPSMISGQAPSTRPFRPRSVQGGQAVAAFALADVVRPESRLAVKRLQEMGVGVAMLTGDSQAVADAVAEELNIDTVFAEVLPEHKDRKVAELQSQGKQVAMVGDGVNDAPALTRADVGIAIGSGTDVAIESAGIILVRSNPLDVVKIFDLSRATYRKMIQNLIWATGYNVVALPLAAGALASVGFVLSPAVGALLMSLSTVIVAINAQLLRRSDLSG